MATSIKSEKFSTKVATEKGARHYPTAFVKATHFNVAGKAGSRTSVIRYKGEWFHCLENPTKAGSFIAGKTAKGSAIPTLPVSAPKASAKAKTAAKGKAKVAKGKAKSAPKAPAKAKTSKGKRAAKATATKESDSRKSRAA